MDTNDLLETVAQVSVTLAALSGVAGVLGPRAGPSQMEDLTVLLLRDVAVVGLSTALLALLPLAFPSANDAEGFVWRGFSAFSIVVWNVALARIAVKARRPASSLPLHPKVQPLYALFYVPGMVVFLWNTIAPDPSSPNRYVGGLICFLAMAGLNFVFAVFENRPDE